jgi:PAS domain S-box-containing protein
VRSIEAQDGTSLSGPFLKQALDELAALAAHIFRIPFAMISLTDQERQCSVSSFGFTEGEMLPDIPFSRFAIRSRGSFSVPNATMDERFAQEPIVTGKFKIGFYAGAPLVTEDGRVIGILAIMDRSPRELGETEQEALRVLSRQVTAQIELSHKTMELAARERLLQRQADAEQRKDALVAALGEVVYDWKPQTNQLFWEGYQQVLGYSPEEMGTTTESWTGRVHPDDLEEVLAEVERAKCGCRNYDLEYRFRHRDGHYCWMHDRGVLWLDEHGELIRVIGVLLEITERREAEEALRIANDRYNRQRAALTTLTRSRVLQAADVTAALREITELAASTLDVERVSVWTFNSQGTALLSVDLFERAAQRHSMGLELKGELYPAYFAALASEDILSVEDAQRDPRTSEFTVRYLKPLGIRAMLDAPIRQGGALAGVLCHEDTNAIRQWTPDEQSFAISVASLVALVLAQSQHQKVEEQLRQSQKMEAIGQLAGGVAHDFNNILAVMMMQAELISLKENLPADVIEGLEEIQVAAERAANLTRQLLLFSRKQVMQLKDLDLNEIVTSLAKMLQRIIGEDVSLRLHLHALPLMARADAGMLDQALLNLAVNARDAMPHGGTLLIETKELTVDKELAAQYPDTEPGRYVGVRVSDSGCGIPPDVLPRIFEPFFTTKEPGRGTGLGLATVFGIVKQHRGWIRVHSEPGNGASFEFFIPSSAVSIQRPARAPDRPRPQAGREKILVAEDEPSVRFLTRVILERQGYSVSDAASGAEAIKLWEAHRGSVRLLLTDLVMPGGMSGQQLARRLREQDPQLKVVFSSGYSAEIAGRELELREGENFLQKPFPPDQLLNTIRRCLDS